ncbi:endonuclease [Caerostris extrusa]|uniref:Endonuclease n=1 Tax=Caerostris extrusa TaxID=172846 RepID=A0AAV4X6I7_CAEEX|nr:endonuclease [Caerostris extrusa]
MVMVLYYYKQRKMESCIQSIICLKKTSLAEEKYSSYELEVLAVVEALKKFRIYLLGNKFKIVTDCSAFEKTMGKGDLVTRVVRWVLLLEEFDYEITHRPGDRMKHVDALSRYPVMKIVDDTITARLKKAQLEDENICSLKQLLNSNESKNISLEMKSFTNL